jgi:putative transposase
VTPAARQRALDHLRAAHRCSERRACGLVGLARLVARYRSRRRDDAQLRARLRELAGRHRRFGYLRLHALLRREGLVINRKRTYRLYQAEDLAVRRRCRRRSPERERRRLVVSEGATSAGRWISRATPCGPAGARPGAALVLRTEQLTPPWT